MNNESKWDEHLHKIYVEGITCGFNMGRLEGWKQGFECCANFVIDSLPSEKREDLADHFYNSLRLFENEKGK